MINKKKSFYRYSDDEEQIVTPFAQILAKLKDVRNNFGSARRNGGPSFRDQHSFLHHDKKGSK